MIPDPPADGNWLAWVNTHYPFERRWQRYLQTRTERPQSGSEQQLEDLRGVPRDWGAVQLAQLWFYCVSHAQEISAAKRAEQKREQEKERRRMISIAKLALDGKLGDSHDDRDAARATAQRFIGSKPPEQLSYWELSDWEKMHAYSRRVANGEDAKRPVLYRDRMEQRRVEREMNEVGDSIGAVDGSRPVRYRQQQMGLALHEED
jgi:hypothetical protein